MTSQVHPSSYISDKVKIANNVKIGPYCYLNGNIIIGENTELKSHVVISGNTQIGKNNTFYPFSNIGCDPQDLKFKGEDSNLFIGDFNIFRENVTISKGTKDGGMLTHINNKTKKRWILTKFKKFYLIDTLFFLLIELLVVNQMRVLTPLNA